MSELSKISRRSFMLMPLAFAACKPGTAIFEISGQTMGTTFNVVATDPSRRLDEVDLRSAINTALAEVTDQMSNWDAASEISRFNQQTGTAPIDVSAPLAKVMQAAENVHAASDGRFDTTMGPLIELWGFGANGTSTMPDENAIASAMSQVGHGSVLRVGASSLQKSSPEAQVYLAAIGKGYGADHVAQSLETLGITDYLVEIGGDLYTSGRNPNGQPWQIGIETPKAQASGVQDVIGVSGLGLASSGDYRNYFEKDGQRYSHIIDPVTGRPITHKTASATVLAEDAMLADAWATAMLILGRERGLEIAEHQNLAVLFIDRDTSDTQTKFKTTASRRFEDLAA